MWYSAHNCGQDRGRRGGRDWPFGEFFFGAGRRARGGWGGRMFAQGDLKIVILQLLAEKPRHGYEIMKAIEEKSGGAYAPSAGAVYPTLTLLEEMGHATASEQDGKKVYTITTQGREYLDQNQDTVDDIFERISDIGATVFSEGMREVGRAFGHVAKATFGASREHLRNPDTSRRILEVLERASREIEDILKQDRAAAPPGGTTGAP